MDTAGETEEVQTGEDTTSAHTDDTPTNTTEEVPATPQTTTVTIELRDRFGNEHMGFVKEMEGTSTQQKIKAEILKCAASFNKPIPDPFHIYCNTEANKNGNKFVTEALSLAEMVKNQTPQSTKADLVVWITENKQTPKNSALNRHKRLTAQGK